MARACPPVEWAVRGSVTSPRDSHLIALPETRFAKAGDLSIAYQVIGEGDVDVVLVPQWLSNIEQYWDHPTASYFLRRLASFCRLILFDKRGTGLSDPADTTQPLEERMDDVLAVMDAVGSERAVLFGASEGGPMAALFAATYPDRCASLVLYGACARWLQAPDYPEGRPREIAVLFGQHWIDGWGSGASLRVLSPTMALDERFRRWWGRFERHSVRPGMVKPIIDTINEMDIRAVLPAIRVPTLIIHRRGDRLIDVANGRFLAEHIEGARYVELPGNDHIYFAGNPDGILDEIEEFVTGSRGAHDPERILATVMFTDIVSSTEHAARLGDRRWHDLIADHDRLIGAHITDYRGRKIRSTGDGVFATFDGPARAIRCALAVIDAARLLDLDIRAGLHTGECELAGDDLAGVTVHIGARIADLAEPSQVLVSGTVRDLVVGSNIEFSYRGEESLQGVPGEWRLFTVDNGEPSS
jgi:class 3 adenylate cyclase/pimeloyl-ACP methyl ester carboxylesterase